MIEIVPSILSKTLEDAQRKLDLCEGSVENVHLDIMDNTFVKNASFPIEQFSSLKTSCKIRAHLMVSDPLKYAQYLQGRVDTIFFHYEAVEHFKEIIDILHQHFHVGVALCVDTPARVLFSHLDKIDYALVMTVTTGFSGGEFHQDALKKVLHLKSIKNDLVVGVDGGVNEKTAGIICRYPADFVTPGSALFGKQNFHDSLLGLKKAFYGR